MPTVVHVHEYNQKTESFTIAAGLPVGASVWSDCVLAIGLVGYRSGQYPLQTIREPGAWTAPGNNVGNLAVSMAYSAAVLAMPHVHGGVGPNHRAALGCRNTVNGASYQYMNIYIGQFN